MYVIYVDTVCSWWLCILVHLIYVSQQWPHLIRAIHIDQMLANFWAVLEVVPSTWWLFLFVFNGPCLERSYQLPSRMCRYDFARAIFSRYSFLLRMFTTFPNSDQPLVIWAAILCNSDGLVSIWSQWRQRRLVLAVSKRLLLSSPLRWLFNMPNGEIWHVVLHEFPCHVFFSWVILLIFMFHVLRVVGMRIQKYKICFAACRNL